MIQKGDIPKCDPKENKNLNKFIILVHEIDEDNYPKFAKTLLKIPKDFEYEDFEKWL